MDAPIEGQLAIDAQMSGCRHPTWVRLLALIGVVVQTLSEGIALASPPTWALSTVLVEIDSRRPLPLR